MVISLATIGMLVLMTFILHISGTTISEILKLRSFNGFASIAIGYFTFFGFMSIFTFPLQLINSIPYEVFVYYFWGLLLLYLLVFLIFYKYWFTTTIFSIKTLLYIFIVISIVLLNYYLSNDTKEFNNFETILRNLFLNKDKTLNFIKEINNNEYGMLPFEGWTTFLMSNVFINKGDISEVKIFTQVFDGIILGSIFTTIFFNFKKYNSQIYGWTLFIFSLGTLLFVKFFLLNFKINTYNDSTQFIYLIIYSLSLMVFYITSNYRLKHMPWLFGIVLGGYIAFSWKSSYLILFLLYTFIFVLQIAYNKSFLKDLFRMSFLSSINIISYNFIIGLYIQGIIFASLLAIFILVLFFTRNNYSNVIKLETYIQSHSTFLILAVPIIFFILSMGIYISLDFSWELIKDNFYHFVNTWFIYIKDEKIKKMIALIIAPILIGLSVIWILFRKKYNKQEFKVLLDVLVIGYITFYNPFVIKILTVFYPDMLEQSGIVMLISLGMLIFLSIFSLGNRIYKKLPQAKQKVKLYNNWKWYLI